MVEPIRMANMRGHTPADLQRGNGDEQKRRARSAGLADHVRLQHVSISGIEMGRRNFV